MKNHFYHAHRVVKERCNGRMNCLRACPTNAIRIREDLAVVKSEFCIDCGECIRVCPEKAVVSVSDGIEDFSSFKYKIVIPTPVLYTQFGLDVHPAMIHTALKKIGFDEVIDVVKVSEELGFVYRQYLKTHPEFKPIISSYCPSVVRLIQVSYPNMVNYVTPIDVPRELIARKAKSDYAKKLGFKKEQIGIIYITPCPAKIVSIKQPAEKKFSWIDGAIPINDIYSIIFPEILELKNSPERASWKNFYYGKGWAVLGHISSAVGAERCLSVAGLSHVKTILDDIENSKLRNIDFVEALACMQGCVGGAFCVENPYVARSNSILLEKKYGSPMALKKEDVLEKYKKKYYFMENPLLPRPLVAFDDDINTSIKKMRQKERILLKLPQKDCGLCGAPTCETFAHDCACDEAELTDCVFIG